MRLLALTLMLATVAEASEPYPLALPRTCRDRSCMRGRVVSSATSLAFFEFAPANGAGMGAACACTNPTGAKGEALTFSRASTATCLKTIGTSPQSVANGDMVTCSSGQARVMPGADGTSVNGLLVEAARTNVALQSQGFDQAAVWVPSSSVVGLPTVTANAGVAPDGTTTAERVQLPAVSSGWSLLQQTGIGAAGTYSEAAWAKGNGQSGTFIIDLGNTNCLTCSYTNGVWARCKQEGRVLGAATAFSIGQDVVDCGGGPFGAQDFFLWQGQMELGATISSDIATTGAAATRVSETANFSVASLGVNTGSTAVTWVPGTLDTTATPIPFLWVPASGNLRGNYSAGKWRAVLVNVSTVTMTSTGSIAANAANRVGAQVDAVPNLWDCLAGVCESTPSAVNLPSGAGTYTVGSFGGASDWANGVVKQVCLDPSSSRCR